MHSVSAFSRTTLGPSITILSVVQLFVIENSVLFTLWFKLCCK